MKKTSMKTIIQIALWALIFFFNSLGIAQSQPNGAGANPDDPNMVRIATQWKQALEGRDFMQGSMLEALKVLETEAVYLRKATLWSLPLLETAAPEIQMKCFRQPPYVTENMTDTVCYKTAAKFVELSLAAMMRFPEAQLSFLQPILAMSASTAYTPLFADSAHSAMHNIREHIDKGGKLLNPNGTALKASDEPQVIALSGLVQAAAVLLPGNITQGLQALEALEAGHAAFDTEGHINEWRVQLGRVGEAVGTLCQKQVFQYTADSAVQSTECHKAAIKLVQLTQATMLRYPDSAQQFYQGLLVFAGWSGDGAAYERVGRAALEQMSLRLKIKEAPASAIANVAATVDEAHRTAAMVLAVNIGQQVGSSDQSQRVRVLRLTALDMYANAIFPLPNWRLQGWQKTVPDLILFLEDQLANPKHGDVERLILCNAYIRSSQWRPDQGLQAAKAMPHLKLLQNSANLTVRDAARAMLAK